MPKTVFIIRHGEKPAVARDMHLSPKGYQRAGALSALFHARHNGGAHPVIEGLFASANSDESHRPVLTVKPLSLALSLPIDDRFADKQFAKLAGVLLDKSEYDGKVVLICWHHGEIPELALALRATGVPPKWPEDRFDLIWRLDYRNGDDRPPLKILPQLLLYGDQPLDGIP